MKFFKYEIILLFIKDILPCQKLIKKYGILIYEFFLFLLVYLPIFLLPISLVSYKTIQLIFLILYFCSILLTIFTKFLTDSPISKLYSGDLKINFSVLITPIVAVFFYLDNKNFTLSYNLNISLIFVAGLFFVFDGCKRFINFF